jgi:hypothetical protein
VGGENVAVSIGQNESCGFTHAPIGRHPVGLLESPDIEGLYKAMERSTV